MVRNPAILIVVLWGLLAVIVGGPLLWFWAIN
jgi:hypothetical protein